MTISDDEADNPGDFYNAEPWSFLYQTGYLSLRHCQNTGKFTLDYPNKEVLMAMSELLITNFFGGDSSLYNIVSKKIKDALAARDIGKLIEEFNKLFANIPYDDYDRARRKILLLKNDSKFDFGVYMFHSTLLAMLYGTDIKVCPEIHGNWGGSDLVIEYNGQIWVIELKVVEKNHEDDDKVTHAMEPIKAKEYDKKFKNPIILAIAINVKKKAITKYQITYF
jgi:hypothetical protein